MPRPSEIRLTDRNASSLPVPAAGTRKYRDAKLKGFALQVTAAGGRSFCLIYTIGGRERLYTIGRWPAWTAARAREEASRLRRMVDQGTDPHELREEAEQAPTVADMIERYEENHLDRKTERSAAEDRSLGKLLRAKLGERKVADVRHDEIDRLHREMTRAGKAPIRANRLVALCSRMFNLSIRWGWRADNPARGIERNPENKRERFLTPAELQRLGAALDAHPEQQSANAIRLLLLTGARRGEVLGATWGMFDLERGVWVKPLHHTKQKKEHRIPLSAPALQILSDLRAKAGPSPYLFPGNRPDRHQTDIKNFWASVCRTADIKGARVHDLRHTHASILASAGLSLPIIGAMLGHTQPQTTARYSHLMDDPLRMAAEKVGSIVTGSGTTAEVIGMRHRGAR